MTPLDPRSRALGLVAGLVLLAWAQGCVRCAEGDVKQGGQCVHPCNADRDCAGDQHCESGACEAGAPPAGASSSSGGNASVGGSSSAGVTSSSALPSSSEAPASSSALPSSSPASSAAAPGSSVAASSAAPSSSWSLESSSAAGTSAASAAVPSSSSMVAPSSSGPLMGLGVVLAGDGVVEDAQIHKGNPAYDTVPSKALENCGATGGFSVGIANWHNWTVMRALVRVDTSSLPRDAVVGRARLGLYVVNVCHSSTVNSSCAEDPAPVTHGLHRLLAPWGEGGKSPCGTASDGEASWNTSVHPTAWAAPGAGMDDVDRVVTPTATADIDASQAGNWVYWDVTADVQAFVADGTANLGWVLQGPEVVSYGRTNTVGFRSHDDTANPGEGPRLLVEYGR